MQERLQRPRRSLQPAAHVHGSGLGNHLACLPEYGHRLYSAPAFIRQALTWHAGEHADGGRGASAEITCPATTARQATFPITAAGTANVVGTCLSGYTGTVTGSCSLSGSWSYTSSCTRASIAHRFGAPALMQALTKAGIVGVCVHDLRDCVPRSLRLDRQLALNAGRHCGVWHLRVGLRRQSSADMHGKRRLAGPDGHRMPPYVTRETHQSKRPI